MENSKSPSSFFASNQIISVRGLSLYSDNWIGPKKRILNDIWVDIPEGEFITIFGKTGSGKTSFMNCLAGYQENFDGEILIKGKSAKNNESIIRKSIGYVPHEDLLRGMLTVRETLRCATNLRLSEDIKREEVESIIIEVIDKLALKREDLEKRVSLLSAGERKRVSIAQELISNPDIILLDEPTSGLDPSTGREIVDLLLSMVNEQGKTIIIITHGVQYASDGEMSLFFGPGGSLCYSGSTMEMMKYFKVDSFEEIYTKVASEYQMYSEECRRINGAING